MNFVRTTAIAAIAITSASAAANAQSANFTLANDDLAVDVILQQMTDGVQINLIVDQPATGNYADLRGLFFDIDQTNLLSGLGVTGSDVTGFDFGGNVTSLGNGNTMSPASFDAGVALGTSGASPDFIGSTSFLLTGLDLDNLLGQRFGLRATSVGTDPTGDLNDGSVKLLGTSSVPEPASLGLLGLAALALTRRR